MQVRAIVYNAKLFSDDLYQRALALVDPESSARIKKFFRRDDACRTLIGRLLTRVLLRERGIPVDAMAFGVTQAGKPFITTPGMDPPIAYNITHDNALVAMAFGPSVQNPPAFSIGIDVMKVRVPGRESFRSFVSTVDDQLTVLERRSLISTRSEDENLRRFFWMWTIKEAYTKALGIGLGFEFHRVEFDAEENVVRVDGEIPLGWCFNRFLLNDGDDLYQGVVAEY
ncbi:hypothetical protein BDZ94DRAFT_1293964, partial [Collybia nuda]